jgi:hypothetical protein
MMKMLMKYIKGQEPQSDCTVLRNRTLGIHFQCFRLAGADCQIRLVLGVKHSHMTYPSHTVHVNSWCRALFQSKSIFPVNLNQVIKWSHWTCKEL